LIRNSDVLVCFLDNDYVWQDALFFKLHVLGINEHLWRVLRESYTGFEVCISHNGLQSDMIHVKQGVGRGRMLSAWMCLVYIKDLLIVVSNSKCGINIYNKEVPGIFLADDTYLLSSSPKSF